MQTHRALRPRRPFSFTDLPDGLRSWIPVQPLAKKYFASPIGRNSIIDSPIPPQAEGRIAIVTDVERGMRWTRRRRKTSGVFADGEVVWSWRPDAGVKSVKAASPAMVAKEPGHQGEREGNR
jgi:hypothetical protein